MTIDTSLSEIVGDIARFGGLADRVEEFIESQTSRFHFGQGEWLILPWVDSFYLFSASEEGQRHGRESITAFLGPSVVEIERVSAERLAEDLPADWQATGLTKASRLRRVRPGVHGASEMLSRLEELIAALGVRTKHELNLAPRHSDLVRDFRLALLNRDAQSATELLDQIGLTGRLSAENLRYLRIEYLASFGRWSEIHAMPHIPALVKSRRPKVISETLLRMIWWVELVDPNYASAQEAFLGRDLLERFGPLFGSVRVPVTVEGRKVNFLAAHFEGDSSWKEEVLNGAIDDDERLRLQRLITDESSQPPERTEVTEDSVAAAYRAARYSEVVRVFVSNPLPEHAELALQSILDSGDFELGRVVLDLVRDFVATNMISLSRRGRRDLEELEASMLFACSGWVDWATRLGKSERWSEATNVLRNNHELWEGVGGLSSAETTSICNSLLDASGGPNADQIRSSLDILCHQASQLLQAGQSSDFCELVLVLLSDQENFSEMVRNAYLDLFAAWLESGLTAQKYCEVLDQTRDIWNRISSPKAVDWSASILEAVLDAPCQDDGQRRNLAVLMIDDSRRHGNRLSLRQRIEVEGLASDFGLPTEPVEADPDERDVWAGLDGKVVGVYSLLSGAETRLRERLLSLCAVGEVKGNSDKVATQALKSLARRADFMIVDTWHAAHQATGAIDDVRPKKRQILPAQKGVSGFVRALESVLGS